MDQRRDKFPSRTSSDKDAWITNAELMCLNILRSDTRKFLISLLYKENYDKDKYTNC